MCSVVFLSLQLRVGYRAANKVFEEKGGNQDRFWYFTSPVCVEGKEYFASLLYTVKLFSFTILTSGYGYLGYLFIITKIDGKYITSATKVVPLAVVVMALANGVVGLNKVLADASEVISPLLQLLVTACISGANYHSYAEIMVAVARKHVNRSQFAASGQSPVPNKVADTAASNSAGGGQPNNQGEGMGHFIQGAIFASRSRSC